MRQTEKKQIKEWCKKFDYLVSELETLKDELQEIKDEHEGWMSDRDCETDYEFSNTPTGERASEEFDIIDTAWSDFEDAIDTIRDAIEPVCELVNYH